jgi:hypothetical protein
MIVQLAEMLAHTVALSLQQLNIKKNSRHWDARSQIIWKKIEKKKTKIQHATTNIDIIHLPRQETGHNKAFSKRNAFGKGSNI